MEEEINETIKPDIQEDSYIDLRSEMLQEIISNKPDFSEKWALPIFLFLLLLVLGATWFVKYPDVIEAPAILTSYNAPKDIVLQQNGRLTRIFFHNNEKVKQGDIIGWIESTASHQEVIRLSDEVDKSIDWVSSDKAKELSNVFRTRYSHLGELQQTYQEFISAWQLFNDYTINGFYARNEDLLERDMQTMNKSILSLQNQKKLLIQDIELAKESFKMNEILSKENVLSKEEYRIQQSKFVNKQIALPQLETSILAVESQKRNKEKEIDILKHNFAQQKIIFEQELLSLRSSLANWKKKYLLESPVNGNLFFTVPIQENQYLRAGEHVGYVNPDDTRFYAEAMLPQSNFGKIDTGMKVHLRFEAYPYQENGYVEGTIDYISKIPSDSGFLATIRLDNGLITNNLKNIPYKSKLRAQALVITNNMRLLSRFYYSIIKSTSMINK